MKASFFLIYFSFSSFFLMAQQEPTTELEQLFHKAYCTNNIPLWEAGIQQLKATYQTSKDPLDLLAIAQAEYGLASSCMGNKEMEKAEKVVTAADDHLLEVLAQHKDNADANALYGGILGLQIGFSPFKGMWLGAKSGRYISTALKLEADNPIAWYQEGSSYYHTPSMFGGDLVKAEECYAKAVGIYEQKGGSLTYNWQYLNTLVWLGQAYLKNGKKEAAIATFKKCLTIAPNFGWVKHQLLPVAEQS